MKRKSLIRAKVAAVVLSLSMVFGTVYTVSAENSSYHHSDMQGEEYIVTGTTNYLAIRSAPNYSSDNELGRIYNGESVYLMSKRDGTYWMVSSPTTGFRGYVDSRYLVAAGHKGIDPSNSNSSTTYTNVVNLSKNG